MSNSTELVTGLIERLEMRRVAVEGLECTWCLSCHRVTVRDPKVKGSFECLSRGGDECRQVLSFGTISKCIEALRANQQSGEA